LLCSINANFESDNKQDPELKIMIFITHFANHYVGSQNINSTVEAMNEYKIIETYMEMLKGDVKHIEKDTLLEKLTGINKTMKQEILSSAYFANTFALLIEKYAKEHSLIFPTKQVSKLFNYIIKLFLINYHSEQLLVSANDNLSSNYNTKIEFALIQCEYINEIQELLKVICPHNMNMLAVLVNQLLKPLFV
jgi:hypothetical protein